MSELSYPYKQDVIIRTPFQIAQGVYSARCYAVVFLGTFAKVFGNNNHGVYCPISFSWEIGLSQKNNIGERKPITLHQVYHYTTDPNGTLFKMLQGWNGRFFTEEDIAAKKHHPFKYAGKYCRLIIGEKITAIKSSFEQRPFVQEVMVPDAFAKGLRYKMPVYWFSAATKNRDMALFMKLPKWMQKKIRQSREWAEQDYKEQMEDFFEAIDILER